MKRFRAYIKMNKCICIHSYGIWIALFTGILLCISQYIQETIAVSGFLEMYKKAWPSMLTPHSVFEKWIGGEMFSFQYFAFFIGVPLLTNLPFGNRLAVDIKKRYIVNEIVRGDRTSYYWAKVLIAFLSGGIVVIIPLLTNLILTAMTLPSINPNNATGFFAIRNGWFMDSLFYSKPYLYILVYFVIIFIFSGLMSAFSISLGLCGISPFLNMLYPFIISVTLYAFLSEFHIFSLTPFYFLNPAQVYKFNIMAVLFEAILLISFVIWGYYRGKNIDIY